MLLRYFLTDTEMVSVATMTTGINFLFTFHIRCFSFVRSLCFRIFSASFSVTFLCPEIVKYINVNVPLSLSCVMVSGVRFIVRNCSVGLRLLIL